MSDTGSGIEERRLGKVFEKGETDGRDGGTGLGLAIVGQVVAAHGGEVYARSRAGEGTTFVFDIPGEWWVQQPRRGPRLSELKHTPVHQAEGVRVSESNAFSNKSGGSR